MAKSTGHKGKYQRVMPIMSKDIGKNWLKTGQGTEPHQGPSEQARRVRQLDKAAAKRAKKAKKLEAAALAYRKALGHA